MAYTFSYQDGRNRVDPQRSYKWVAQFPFIFPELGSSINVEQFTAPFPHVNAEPFQTQGSTIYFPTTSDMDGLTATFYLDEGAGTLLDIKNWKNMIQNSDGTFNVSDDYKFPVIFILKSAADVPVAIFTYTGVFPTQTQALDADYSTSDRMRIMQSFSCDGLEILSLGFSSLSGLKKSLVNVGRSIVAGAASGFVSTVTGSSTLGAMAGAGTRVAF